MRKLIVSLPWRVKSAALSSFGVPSNPSGAALAVATWDYPYALADDANNLISQGKATLNLLPSADKTILVAPAQALSWHQIDLPKAPKARLRAALDGLLEERLLDDTDALCFALSPEVSAGKASTNVWVAACDKAWLSNAIALFESAGCRVTQVVPEYWPMANHVADADDASSAFVCVTGSLDEAWLTHTSAQGVLTMPLQNHDLSGAAGALLVNFPADAPVLAEPAVAALAEQTLSRPVLIRQQAAGLLQSAQSPWELAQFEQRLSGDGEGIKRIRRAWQTFWRTDAWRPARWGLIAIFVANILGLNAWAWQQKTSLAAKKAQLSAIVTQTFPTIIVVVDPQAQMSKELATLRQTTGNSSVQNFETMLSAFGSVAPINTESLAIDFSNNTLVLKGLKLPPAEFNTAQNKLKNMGYDSKLDNDKITMKAINTP